MPAVTVVGDYSTGHGCFPPTKLLTSPVQKTFFNGKKPAVVDESCQFASHNCGLTTHPQNQRYPTTGTGKTKIEGYYLARIADDIYCGDTIAQGSTNTFIE